MDCVSFEKLPTGSIDTTKGKQVSTIERNLRDQDIVDVITSGTVRETISANNIWNTFRKEAFLMMELRIEEEKKN